ncbi:hypothetical protein BEWA_032150 [Theileria equi strain WA]|uniref:Uncharacterized protein n=1 Tax=Theileria equi strain WA TaxID=1537102 RepID=L0AXR9_THEEQ|nr:hypothetical protein BEWA_032150 [Theileria equi strain WA]AFZ80362.1 hypothetical protein BEWA_032150 [Theileria equi strain WA]|eukprot:XP_004830028.1 hypothetical protein BEWA_032150 [Theileria equi strain WA]
MATIHTPGFNSPIIRTVNSPVANGSQTPITHFDVHSPVAQSPTSYSLAGAIEVNKPAGVQNMAGLNTVDYTSGALSDFQQTREIPTVYLPPIQYRYDPATGKLIQVGDNQAGVATAPPPSIPGQYVSGLAAQYGQTVQPQFVPSNAQNVETKYSTTQMPQVQYRPASVQYGAAPQTRYVATTVQTEQPQPIPNLGQTDFSHISQIPTVYETFNAGGYNGAPQANVPFSQLSARHTQPVAGAFGQQAFGGFSDTTEASRFAGSPTNGYRNDPGARFVPEAQQNERARSATSGFGNAPHGATGSARVVNSVASKAFSNFEDTAARIFSAPDSFSASNIRDAAFGMLHPNSSNFARAATFKLQRLENVPVNPLNTSKVAFGVVAYFDVNTENYNVYKSNLHWGLPSKISGLVNCNFMSEIVKIPWRGEEFVYLKILEQVGQSTCVLGRLQLKLATLVSGHPLRIPIIGDDGNNKGNAILEFSVGSISVSENRRFNEEANRVAAFVQEREERSKCNRMPDYATALQERQQFEAGRYDDLGQSSRTRRVGPNLHEHELQIPKALDQLVRWCCDITDRDLY